jgi:hypothetical protein
MRSHLAPRLLLLAMMGAATACYDRATTAPSVQLPAPVTLTSISLNSAVHLQWSDNPFEQYPNDFSYYRVYSTSYSLDNNLCGASWSLEGTTVAPTFLAGALANGVPMCFSVTAVSLDGTEGTSSPLRNDTPRPDGQNVLVFTIDTLAGAQSGFRFWLDANGNGQVDVNELGLVGPGSSATADFYVMRDATGTWLVPQRAGVTMQVYGSAPITDVTSIDVAPNGGYSRNAYEAVPLWGYVFQTDDGIGFYKYGAVRVSAVGSGYVILDWSYQTDPGNPELLVVHRPNAGGN